MTAGTADCYDHLYSGTITFLYILGVDNFHSKLFLLLSMLESYQAGDTRPACFLQTDWTSLPNLVAHSWCWSLAYAPKSRVTTACHGDRDSAGPRTPILEGRRGRSDLRWTSYGPCGLSRDVELAVRFMDFMGFSWCVMVFLSYGYVFLGYGSCA